MSTSRAIENASPVAVLKDLRDYSIACEVSEKLAGRNLSQLEAAREFDADGEVRKAILIRGVRLQQWLKFGPDRLFCPEGESLRASQAEARLVSIASVDPKWDAYRNVLAAGFQCPKGFGEVSLFALYEYRTVLVQKLAEFGISIEDVENNSDHMARVFKAAHDLGVPSEEIALHRLEVETLADVLRAIGIKETLVRTVADRHERTEHLSLNRGDRYNPIALSQIDDECSALYEALIAETVEITEALNELITTIEAPDFPSLP